MSELEYVFIKGFRKNSQLLLVQDENQLYKYKYTRADVRYYVCYSNKCPVNVAVDLKNTVKCRKTNQCLHNHGDQEELIKKLELLNEIKHNCENVSLKRSNIRDVFDSTCKKFKGNTSSVEFEKIRRNLYKIKSKTFPQSPSSFGGIVELFADTSVMKELGMSRLDGSKEFYRKTVMGKTFAYSIFMSQHMVELISNLPESQPRKYVIDGTFSIAPKDSVFNQVLIIHYAHADCTFPFIYVLISDKTEVAYTDALEFIKANLFDLKPATVQTGFETDLWRAIRNVYLEAEIVPCWFHFTQAIRAKALQIPGLIKCLNQNDSAKRHFRKYLYLPLLKSSELEAAFFMLKDSSLAIEIEDDFESIFKRFNSYFEEQWIEQITPHGLSVNKMSLRTSSALEEFNSGLSSKLAKNGSFFKFLDILLDEDLQKTSDLQKLIDGNVSICEPRKKSIANRDKLIMETVDRLEMGKLTLCDVLSQFAQDNVSEFKRPSCIDGKALLTPKPEADDDDLSNCKTEECNPHQASAPCKDFKLCSDCFERIKSSCDKCNGILPILSADFVNFFLK